MEEPKWENDPSVLHMIFTEGESATVGVWKLRIAKYKPNELSPVVDRLMADLTDNEREALDRLSSGEEKASRKRHRDDEASYLYSWSLTPSRDGAATFEGMGGSAETIADAKRLALKAVELAYFAQSALS